MRYLEQLRWAGGVCVSRLRGGEGSLSNDAVSMDVSWLSPSMHRDGWNRVREGSHAVAELVRRGVVCNQLEHGVSALGLQRVLGLSSYQTAWAMLHRLRRAMVRPGRERLGGAVEVDETYVGSIGRVAPGRERDAAVRHWRNNIAKAIVAIAVEVHEPKGFGRVRLRRVPRAAEQSLVPFVCEVVEPGAEVRTDGSPVYRSLPEHGYTHHRTVASLSDNPAHVSMPAVHRVASLLKRWLLGTREEHVGDMRSLSETEHLLERVGFTVLESRYTFGVFASQLAWEQCLKVAPGSRYLSRLGRPVLNGLATLEFAFGIPDDGNT